MRINSFINPIPPMGIYETLYAFQNSFGKYMGSPGTHPWSQGYPLTTQLPGGPKMPETININPEDLKYVNITKLDTSANGDLFNAYRLDFNTKDKLKIFKKKYKSLIL